MKNRTCSVLVVLLVSACATATPFQRLRSRAALDFECQPDQIQTRDVNGTLIVEGRVARAGDIGSSPNGTGNGTVIAEGCGKRAIYVKTCVGQSVLNCNWLLNSPISSVDDPATQNKIQPASSSH